MISSGSGLAEDIRYGLAHWEGLTRFLNDGRLELDTNLSKTPSGRSA
jgi:transposase